MTDGPAAEVELEKIRLQKQLEAEEAARAHNRELAKLDKEQVHAKALADKEAAKARVVAEFAATSAKEVAQIEAESTEAAARDARSAELAKLQEQSANELRKAQWDAEHQLHKAYHDNLAEVAKGSIERAQKGAEFLEKAALSIAAIYTGLLGLVFSVTDRPLPRRGVYPAIFFGLAVASAAAYLAFLRKADTVSGRKGGSTLRTTQENRTFFFVDWVMAGVFNKRYALRVGVLALMFGVAFLPAPFVAEPSAANPSQLVLGEIEAPIPDEDIEDPGQRAERFRVDLRVYDKAAQTAISQAGPAGGGEPERRNHVERNWTYALVLGLVFCLLGPVVYEWITKRVRTDP